SLVGPVGAYHLVRPAPDGDHLLVTAIHRPYSYVVTAERFPHDVEVWSRNGTVRQKLASLPLFERVPIQGVPTGPRDYSWRATQPATLIWAEALDQGDWNVVAPARDKLLMQRAPFDAPPVEVARLEQRYSTFLWGEHPGEALLMEYDRN